ncbi:hypothetical protein, partial [Arthrobacter sp. Ld5]|uniref:hypothetical protein n=1 Tax=Arthrobacter sp. Ld5 TaxID=649152 RepID=UPI003EBA3A1F
FETSQKNQPPHGVRQPANSTNQKTIGINKLGTLLSSQTTGTTDYSRNPAPSAPLGFAFPRRCVHSLFHFLFPCQIPPPWPTPRTKEIRQRTNPLQITAEFATEKTAHEPTTGI